MEPRRRRPLRRALPRRRERATDIARAIFAYNHAQWYVDDVLQLAAHVRRRRTGADAVFSLDRMAIALEQAQEQVATLSEQLTVAEERARRRRQRTRDRLAAAAADLEQLLSDRVLAEKDSFQAGQELRRRHRRSAAARAELAQAQAALETAQSGAESASFAPAAAGVLRMPTSADGYVFPVGGGPGVVSVGHQHHDYPAADIAAPLGAPLYALADGVVLSVVDDGRCGIGFVLRTLDGLEWVYCHLSYRDPGLEEGAAGQRGAVGRARRLDRALDRPASPPRPSARALSAGDAVVPGVRRASPSCGRTRPSETEVRSTPVFALVPPEEPAEDVVEFTLSGG